MNKLLRKEIINVLNTGWSASNIYNSISHLIYMKRVYNRVSVVLDSPEDIKTPLYIELSGEVERIINVLKWDKKAILNNFNQWIGLK